MSVEIYARRFESPEYDSCGNLTVAVMEINGILIPLCEECLNELNSELKRFNSIVFCYMCKHFIPNEAGHNYSGSCKKKAADAGYILKEEVIGYVFEADSMDMCEHACRETQEPAGHNDPIGPLGRPGMCPVCNGIKIEWNPETEISHCLECGWSNPEEAEENRTKRKKNGELG